jgi:hypothetical protein
MSKKATIKKVDDASWLVIDQHRGNVGVLYQNVQNILVLKYSNRKPLKVQYSQIRCLLQDLKYHFHHLN